MRHILTTLLTMLLPGLLVLAPPASATAPPADSARSAVVLDPGTARRGAPLSVPWLDVRRNVLHDGGSRIRLQGTDIPGSAKEIRSAADGHVLLTETLNRAFLFRVDARGRVARLAREREIYGSVFVDTDGERLAYATYDDDGAYVTVLRISDGRVLARHTSNWHNLLGFADGEVWLSARPGARAPFRLVSWNPESDTMTQHRRGRFDGLSLEHGAAWRFKGIRRIRMVPVRANAGWRPWTAAAHVDSTVSFSPDGTHLVTYTRAHPRRDRYPYPGRLVVRETETGEAVRTFRGWPYGDSHWETNRRFVGQAYAGSSFRVAQLRMNLAGGVRRVSRFARFEVPRILVDARRLSGG